MKSFDTKKFKDNFLYFLITGIIIVILFVFSIFYDHKNTVLEDEILSTGKESYSKLVINEISSNNNGTIMASDGETYDWIEIYNGKSHNIDLTNYSLSDTNDKIKWVFPENTIIKSKEYLIVFLGGVNKSGLIANFKLASKGGETLVLRNAKKKIIDAIEILPLTSNQVMARDVNADWHIYGVATPGYANTTEGNNNYLDSIEIEKEPQLAINEVLPKNKGEFKDSYGEYSGYIEIINISDETVNLNEYAISNDQNIPFKYNLPDIKLSKGSIFLIYTSNRNTYTEKEYHANFKLISENGIAILSHQNKITSKVEYSSLANGLALIRDNNNYVSTANISPGYPNNKDGISDFQNKYLKPNDGLIINEAMTSNYSYMAHNGETYYDWIELYNNSNKEINLKDYCLYKEDNGCSNKLPDVILKSHSYYVLMASGDTNLSTNDYQHLNFKLSVNDAIYLFKDSKIIDALFIPDLSPGYSYGRDLKYGLRYFSNPTPNSKNNDGILAISTPPTINTVGGIYNNIENLEISMTGEGNVYYTTDGTDPNSSSKKYIKPFSINRTTVIKAISIVNGKKNSAYSYASYIINENHTVPVLSVVLEPDDFRTLNRLAWTTGIEKSAHATYFEKDQNGFDINCGLKLFGGSTRGPAKKSYALKFKKVYGESKLNYQVFNNRNYSSFDSLVLRTASQDEPNAMIRDILGTSLVDGLTEVNVQAYKTIILYINGEYWGIYFIREKVDEEYVQNNFNISSSGTDLLRVDGEVKVGNKSNYNSLISFMNTNDLSIQENYNYVKTKININSIIDFWIAATYVTNNDIVNYRYFRNPDVDDGKWQFVFYDLDWAWYNYSINYYNFFTSGEGMTVNHYPTVLMRNLMKSSEFRKTYVERLSKEMKTVWNKERVLKKYDELVKELEPEIKRNHTRWNHSIDEYHKSLEELKSYINKREEYLLKQTKSYFNLSNSDMEKYFGD